METKNPRITKNQDPKCNNVQILLKVSKIPKGSKLLVAQASLDGKTVNKKQHVQGDNKVAIPFSFKKLNPCPVVGDSFSPSILRALVMQRAKVMGRINYQMRMQEILKQVIELHLSQFQG